MMNSIIIIVVGVLGATSTFYVSGQLKQGAVRASAGLSLLVGLFFYLCPDLLNAYLTEHIPLVFIGASFVGMVSSKVIDDYWQLVCAGVLLSVLYLNASDFFSGYGGLLGTSAFISLLATLGVSLVFKELKRAFQ